MFEIAGGIILAVLFFWALRFVLGLMGVAIAVAGAPPRAAGAEPPTPASKPAAAEAPPKDGRPSSQILNMSQFVDRYLEDNAHESESLEEQRNRVNSALYAAFEQKDRERLSAVMDGLPPEKKMALLRMALDNQAGYVRASKLKLSLPNPAA